MEPLTVRFIDDNNPKAQLLSSLKAVTEQLTALVDIETAGEAAKAKLTELQSLITASQEDVARLKEEKDTAYQTVAEIHSEIERIKTIVDQHVATMLDQEAYLKRLTEQRVGLETAIRDLESRQDYLTLIVNQLDAKRLDFKADEERVAAAKAELDATLTKIDEHQERLEEKERSLAVQIAVNEEKLANIALNQVPAHVYLKTIQDKLDKAGIKFDVLKAIHR